MVRWDLRIPVIALLIPALACATGSSRGGEDEGEPVVTAYTLRAALENIMVEQQTHFYEHGWYASTLLDLDYVTPPGVDLRLEMPVDPKGYFAIARGGGAECAVFAGTSHPPRHYLTRRDQVGCSP